MVSVIMPSQESAGLVEEFRKRKIKNFSNLTRNDCAGILREYEVIAYHHLVNAFRGQGHLTSEKLKLLKEVAVALNISDERHRIECQSVTSDAELSEVAKQLWGPNTECGWKKEGLSGPLQTFTPRKIEPAFIQFADAVAEAIQAEIAKLDPNDNSVVRRTIKLKTYSHRPYSKKKTDISGENKDVSKLKTEVKEEVVEKEEEKDDDTSSSISSASEIWQEDEEIIKSEEKESASMKKDLKDLDKNLMPPPPPPPPLPPTKTTSAPTTPPSPGLTTTTSSAPLSPPLPVITVPSPTVVTTPSPTVSSSPETNSFHLDVETSLDVSELTEVEAQVQAQSEAQAREEFLSSLPPLVVVPPADSMEVSIPHSLTPTSTLVFSPNMSIQLADDVKRRKRAFSQDSAFLATSTPSKTMALNTSSKITPIMVTTSNVPIVSNQGQVKVTPVMTRVGTTQATQKLIIVPTSQPSNTQNLQRSFNVTMSSAGLPILRPNQPRLQAVSVSGHIGGTGTGMRPKLVTVPAKCRAKGNQVFNLKNAITLKQENIAVMDTSVKRLPGQTKILPKPSGSVFIVNTGQGTPKLGTTHTVAANSRQGGESKPNIVFVQKGGNQRTLTVSNKDIIQKLMSKKCVVIQSSKVVPKAVTTRPPATPPLPPVTSASNVVVLDLSQEQFRQNLNTTTLAEILQASGIIPSTSHTVPAQNPVLSEATQVASEGEWLPVEDSKSLSLEEVTIPVTSSESFVTLDEAVEVLGDHQQRDNAVAVSEGDIFTSSDNIFTITSDQLSSGDLAVVTEKTEPITNQIVIETLPTEVVTDMDCVTQTFLSHKDGAVAIQHSNIGNSSRKCILF